MKRFLLIAPLLVLFGITVFNTEFQIIEISTIAIESLVFTITLFIVYQLTGDRAELVDSLSGAKAEVNSDRIKDYLSLISISLFFYFYVEGKESIFVITYLVNSTIFTALLFWESLRTSNSTLLRMHDKNYVDRG
jgi:hypothetical protein